MKSMRSQKKEYEKIAETGKGLIQERLKTIVGSGKSVAAFNTLGFERGALLHSAV